MGNLFRYFRVSLFIHFSNVPNVNMTSVGCVLVTGKHMVANIMSAVVTKKTPTLPTSQFMLRPERPSRNTSSTSKE